MVVPWAQAGKGYKSLHGYTGMVVLSAFGLRIISAWIQCSAIGPGAANNWMETKRIAAVEKRTMCFWSKGLVCDFSRSLVTDGHNNNALSCN